MCLFYGDSLCRAFDLESTDGCNRDYVEIRDGRDTSVSYGRFCGQSIPTNVSVAQSMMVKFRSDLANQLTGFTAQFSTREYHILITTHTNTASLGIHSFNYCYIYNNSHSLNRWNHRGLINFYSIMKGPYLKWWWKQTAISSREKHY